MIDTYKDATYNLDIKDWLLGDFVMLAMGMIRGKAGVHLIDIKKPEIEQEDEVMVRVKEVGVDGTDLTLVKHQLQDIEEASDSIVLGHEMVGIVEEVGRRVKSLSPGDIVVVTVRRGCDICQPCLHNQSDMCMTGLYTERGLHKRNGFLSQFVVDKEQYITKVPDGLERLAIFTEPLSICEKAVEQIRIIQSRLPWACPHPEHKFDSRQWGTCKTALVVGAGSLGLLAAALLRLSGVLTFLADIVPEDSLKVHMVEDIGANYINASNKKPKELVEICCSVTGNLDIILEAAGAAATAVELINYMSRSSIYVMTGIPREKISIKLDAAQMVRQIVRYNQVIVGSVNSNRRHFEMAIRDIPDINLKFTNIMNEMITHCFPIRDYNKAFELDDKNHIKTVIEVEPWK
ncbi:MAG: alcohol dehydrogenase catalytic domain-containing protein [Dehalococcoidia bacterium]|nr:MAG: alcohol dehydrogenase catalytic domain-containing protein [Dehalococcoidia bacterium]